MELLAPPAEDLIRERAYLFLRRRLLNAAALGAADVMVIGVVAALVGMLPGAYTVDGVLVWSWYLPALWVCGAFLKGLLPSWGLGPVIELRRLVLLTGGVFAATALVGLMVWDAREPLVVLPELAIAFVLCLVLIPFVRTRVKRMLIVRGVWGVPAVVYGGGDTAASLVELMQQERGLGYTPIGIFDDDPFRWPGQPERPAEAPGGRVERLGSLDAVTREAPVAIVALADVGRSRFAELMQGPLGYYHTVLIIPDLSDVPSLWVRPCDMNGMLGLEISCNLVRPLSRFTKRTLDLLLVVATIPFWGLLCAALGLMIWFEDRQSPLYFQRRVGKGGQCFWTWKFRTMVVNAEEILQQRLAEDADLRREWEAFYKLRHDPRVTRIGRLLRMFSLDELPQLMNVLRGEMSLVGPRPLPPYHHSELSVHVQGLRTRVRPGLTGLWQVSGRSDSGTAGMEQWDPYYVRNWSPWLDFVILVRTARAVVERSGAY